MDLTERSFAMPANIMTIATWVLRVLLGLAFLAAAYLKLSGQPMMVEEFGKIGMGDGFRLLTGAIELVGALLILYPRTTPWGCLVLLPVMVGAFIAQIGPLHGDVIHVFVFAAVLLALFWLTRDGVMGKRGTA
jgi:uncharacterized membrane protein YphA (DoxX/SURF4 family)